MTISKQKLLEFINLIPGELIDVSSFYGGASRSIDLKSTNLNPRYTLTYRETYNLKTGEYENPIATSVTVYESKL